MPEFINTAEAARRMNVSVAVVKQWLKSGEIRGWKVNARAWIIDADSIKTKKKDPRGRKRKV